MLSHKIITRQDVGRLASYYEDSADDYYAKQGDGSQWQGKGAAVLGLSGSVDPERFRELLSGEVKPGVSTRSSIRKDSEQRSGIDFTFGAPKSVSMQALIHGDERIIEAHDRAVQRAMDTAELRAQARKKVGGRSQVESTGNLIVATFRHETNREVEPHLHTHAVILNLTRRSDGQWRALHNDDLVKTTRYLGAVYRAELANELKAIGYELRLERDGLFDLAHISRQQIKDFSQRSEKIEQRLTEQGLTRASASTGQKQLATMQTRKHKVSMDREAVHNEWKALANQLGIDFERRSWAGESNTISTSELDRVESPSEYATAEAAKRAVRFAVNHLTERQSVVNERVLMDTALKHGVGSARLVDIEGEINQQVASGYLIREDALYRLADPATGTGRVMTREGWIDELTGRGIDKTSVRMRVNTAIEQGGLVPTESRYTTQTALEREKRILQIEHDGRAVLAPILAADIAHAHLASTDLNAGQRGAALLMAITTNRIVGVQGFAGTGKSHMLETAKVMIEREGYRVRTLAPYGSQVKTLRAMGVEANTVASFLRAKEKNIDGRTVLIVDEAGVMPTRLMEQTLKLAEKSGARVVLLGDIRQTKAIESGRPFDQLQQAGMQTARMEEIQRQKNTVLKDAVELAAQGRTSKSLARISGITEIPDGQQRRAKIVDDYMKLPTSDREQTLIISGTNDARREINGFVREAVGTAGKGIEFDTLIRRDTTQAERRFAKYYRVGDMIQPEKDYAKTGLARGVLYKVEDTGPGNRLTVRAASGERFEFSPMTHRKISVYQPERAELATGDVVRITRNDAALNLANGDRLKVEAVQAGRVTLTDGKRRIELATDKPLHVDHAYATTIHSSQGLTADRVLIDTNTKSFTTASDAYYVAISRARLEARIYTDNVKELPKAIARENIKFAALDLTRTQRKGDQNKEHNDHDHKVVLERPATEKRLPHEREINSR